MSEAQYDRIDTLEEMALQFAAILLNPSEKDAQKRAAQRQKAHDNLVRAITSLVSQVRANDDFTEILVAGLHASREMPQNPPADAGDDAKAPQ